MIIASCKMRTSRCGFYTGPASELTSNTSRLLAKAQLSRLIK